VNEHFGLVTFQGGPLTLLGEMPVVGSVAPDFMAVNKELQPVKLSDYKGKVVVITAVPSLDTPVCDMEIRTFNKKAAEMGDDVVILTVSADLPFAQARWCGGAGIDRVITVSDYREREFGTKYGLLIKELLLLARAVFVVDRKGIISYVQLVTEVASEPNYGEVIDAVKSVL
jgi:thioredoxin-dependent peroxiredoxin